MLQLHLGDQHVYCLLRRVLYQRFDGIFRLVKHGLFQVNLHKFPHFSQAKFLKITLDSLHWRHIVKESWINHRSGKVLAWPHKPLPETIMTNGFGDYTFKYTIISPRGQWVNSLWPSDVIWWQGSRLTLAQVMACCLTAPSHYLNQYWLIISEVQWHSV